MDCHKIIKKPQKILAINFLIYQLHLSISFLTKKLTLSALIIVQAHVDLLNLKNGITFMFGCIKKTNE